jgi:LuxR family transcriptional regulator, maltose regulon positive regulatory protein
MPKFATYTLAWSPTHYRYELYEGRTDPALEIEPESSAWFRWVSEVPSFAFKGKADTYTARKELRHGDAYWYAYRRVGGKLAKRYIGSSSELTVARLEQIAEILAELTAREAGLPLEENEVSHQPELVLSRSLGELASSVHTPLTNVLLLLTKLHVPHPRPSLVRRSHLTKQLQHGMEGSLILVSAPAGFGKTTLLAQWFAESALPAAWLSLEPDDNDPTRFLTYLIAALRTVDPQLGAAALPLLHASQVPPPEAVIALLINDLATRPVDDLMLVLDDYHVITAEPVQRAMTFLVEHLPPQLHLIIATRSDPSLPLARLRARGLLTELRTSELRFNPAEAGTYLSSGMGLNLLPEAITSLHNRTEGWIAGLQFAALSLQGRDNPTEFLNAFTGSHRFVLDYLSEEVLSRQPETVQSFLLRTSILERLSGPLCDAVTGQEGSQAMLETLDRANLFVVSLDDERHWFRYHHLFADVLRNRLRQRDHQGVPALHQRASAWYAQQGFFFESVQHALAARDFEQVAQLIEREHLRTSITTRGQVHTVIGWLNALPDPLVRTHPILCLLHAETLLHTNQLQASEGRLRDAELSIQTDDSSERAHVIRGWISTMRGNMALYSGDYARTVILSQQALAFLPQTESDLRATAAVNAARASLLRGDVTSVTEHFIEETIASVRASRNLSDFLISKAQIARLSFMQGKLRRAVSLLEEARQAVLGPEGVRRMINGPSYYFGMAELLCEWNDLDSAERLLEEGMAMVKGTVTFFAGSVNIGYTTLTRLQLARGDYAGAMATLEAYAQLARERHFVPIWNMRGEALKAQLELSRGNLASAVRWADESDLSTYDEGASYPYELVCLTLARVRIAQGRENPTGPFLRESLNLLNRLLADAEAKARMGSALEIRILRALALHAQGDRQQALTTLEPALTFAEPEGYVRLFVDEGKPMLSLLSLARTHGIAASYVATLLSAFSEPTGEAATRPAPHASPLIEQLTEREREVLRLLLEGMSNREIAHRLVVSVNTTKKHVFNICGKLGVQSRTQAIVKARTLNLL